MLKFICGCGCHVYMDEVIVINVPNCGFLECDFLCRVLDIWFWDNGIHGL